MTKSTAQLVSSFAAALSVLGLAVAAPAQQPAADVFLALREQRLRAAELTLSQAARTSPRAAAPSAPQPQELPVASETVPVWARGLSSAQWGMMVESFQAEGVPLELLAVGWVESRFNPAALSPKGARGAWQFMPETARRYGLQVGNTRDDRTDLTLSTRAAARHLADLHRQFGDWPLALAAYNAGAERVADAVARARTRDFWQLRRWLPSETREYVPAVLRAMSN